MQTEQNQTTAGNTLLKVALAAEAAAKADAAREYPLLLEQQSADPANVERIREIMRLLKKSPEDLERDYEVITIFRSMEQVAKRGVGHRAEIDRLSGELRTFDEETKALVAARGEKRKALALAVNELESWRNSGRSALGQMMELKKSHPHLLGTVDVQITPNSF